MHSKLISEFKFCNQSAAEKTKFIFYITCSMAEPLCRKLPSQHKSLDCLRRRLCPDPVEPNLVGATGRSLLRDWPRPAAVDILARDTSAPGRQGGFKLPPTCFCASIYRFCVRSQLGCGINKITSKPCDEIIKSATLCHNTVLQVYCAFIHRGGREDEELSPPVPGSLPPSTLRSHPRQRRPRGLVHGDDVAAVPWTCQRRRD